jgi:hypothetical protein
MAKYNTGDYVKFELTETACSYSEWLWLIVDFCDDEAGLIFGRLDSVPVVTTHLRIGQELAVSFENVRDVIKH